MSIGSFNSLRLMGKCVDDTGDSTTAGTYIELYRCNGGNAQIWALFPDGGVQHSADVNCINAPADIAGTRLRLGNCDPYQVTPPKGSLALRYGERLAGGPAVVQWHRRAAVEAPWRASW